MFHFGSDAFREHLMCHGAVDADAGKDRGAFSEFVIQCANCVEKCEIAVLLYSHLLTKSHFRGTIYLGKFMALADIRSAFRQNRKR